MTSSSILRLWPRSLRSRVFVILFAGLIVAYGLSFSVLVLERYMSAKALMLGTLETDVATSIAILDRLPASERPDWLERLSRGSYNFVIGSGTPGVPDLSSRATEIADRIEEAAGHKYPLRVESLPGDMGRLQAHLTLSDGSPLTIDVTPHPVMPMAQWLPYMLAFQMALIVLCTWFAVRLATRPLAQLVSAANSLDPNQTSAPMTEEGPSEVVQAARAFNAMSGRIAHYLEERVQILAAISHDLQTPITRMKLRAEMADESTEKDKLIRDLGEIERLVQDGIAYARSAHGNVERRSRIDIASFVESLVYDYQDTGKPVAVVSTAVGTVQTKPHALRRILSNFIDNALKFGGSAEIMVERPEEGVAITVLDRGPGIPEEQLEAAMQPFYRLEQSRNRETGGTGLGLAIAQQLATALGGSIQLSNRQGGGLAAKVYLP